MALYVGLDVSLRTISVCIVQAKGNVVWEGKVLCEGPALIAALKSVGIEAGPLSEWLFGILTECHFKPRAPRQGPLPESDETPQAARSRGVFATR